MAYDYSKLLGLIVEKYGTQAKFANAMATSERTISLKLNCKVDWKQNEIVKAADLLGINKEEIPTYFFKLKVQN